MTIPIEREEHVAELAEHWGRFLPRIELQSTARANRRRHASRLLTRLATILLLDAVGVFAASLIMVAVHPADGFGYVVRWSDPFASALAVFAQSVVAVWSGLFLMRAYEEGDAVHTPSRVVSGVALGLLLLHWSMIWHDGITLLTAYLPAVAIFAGTIWITRRVSDRSMRALWPSAGELPRALFVGRPDEVERAMQDNPLKGANAVLPVAQLDLERHERGRGPDICSVESRVQAAIYENAVDTTLLCGQFTDVELAQIVETAEASGCRVISLSRAFTLSRVRSKQKTYDHTPVVELTQPGIRGRDLLLKRAFDFVIALLLVVILAPVMLVVALLVKLSSPGPVLFRQERVGYIGSRFHILKFRSMRADAESQLDALRNDSIYTDARLFKVVRDPRVTPLGRFLRRSSLDELPQLFNVLGGSMSLVGPRPPLPQEVEMYGARSFLRFDVKPGITGPWQVNGRNTITCFDEVVALEAAYVHGWTIWRDFVILARTVPVVLKMDGAH